MTKSVAVLGCGPAGLLVAHAATLMDWDFRIYSKKQKSKLFGAQYFHKPIVDLDCGTPVVVDYTLRGTPEQYRRKVYGHEWDGTVSPEDYMESHHAWDIRHGYDRLWDMYAEQITNIEIGPRAYYTLRDHWSKHDLVISTVPRTIWAEPGDDFVSQQIWALGDAEHTRVRLHRPEPFTVVCDGTDAVPWYRVSNIFGYCTMEWPYNDWYWQHSGPPCRGASLVKKPLRHNSTAASDFVHLGRYGKWEKGVLTTDAFYDALKVLADDRL